MRRLIFIGLPLIVAALLTYAVLQSRDQSLIAGRLLTRKD